MVEGVGTVAVGLPSAASAVPVPLAGLVKVVVVLPVDGKLKVES